MVPTKSILRDNEDVDWVQRRAACTTAGVLKLLRECARTDVDQFNSHSASDLRFRVENDRAYMFGVHGQDDAANASAVFHVQDETIVVRIEVEGWGCETFTVAHQWESETATCVLTVDDKPQALWQLSQRALLPLFFG